MSRKFPTLSIMRQALVEYASKPIYWAGFFLLPLFVIMFLSDLMKTGLPEKAPAAIVDLDHSQLSRSMTQSIDAMQLVSIAEAAESYTEARNLMQQGKVFGYFLIPQNFEEDFLAGKNPTVSFYTNATYYVPAALLFKTFKTSASYTKAGLILEVARDAGLPAEDLIGTINPISVVTHPIGNPWLNYSYYLSVSFIPAAIQLMILLMTVYTLGQNIKFGRTRSLLQQSKGSIIKIIFAQLFPQTIIWTAVTLFMESYLFGWLHFPMNGSLMWLTLSEIMFVIACQGFGIFIFEVLPNLRLAASVSALLGILTFSIAAFSFPVQSMYPAVAIFSYIIPTRYNFLIYIDQALNGIDIYYSRWWYVAYIIFILLPLPLLWRIKKAYRKPVYVP